ncbi:hypothetical protein [Halococcus sediminicola]|uniref:hypothetical protein n=1 Tax=Halococcus sediminicola TaxID=1264579 RepID=UPI000678D06C|nr:hypothetical protein [Halococcus sediminicola]
MSHQCPSCEEYALLHDEDEKYRCHECGEIVQTPAAQKSKYVSILQVPSRDHEITVVLGYQVEARQKFRDDRFEGKPGDFEDYPVHVRETVIELPEVMDGDELREWAWVDGEEREKLAEPVREVAEKYGVEPGLKNNSEADTQ